MRLTALRDAPYAFSTTFESASSRSTQSWHEQADSAAEGNQRFTVFAFCDGVLIGMASVYREAGDQDNAELLQMWVAAEHRGSTVAHQIIDAAIEWCWESGIKTLVARTTIGNDRAKRFYLRQGFQETGTVKMSPDDCDELAIGILSPQDIAEGQK